MCINKQVTAVWNQVFTGHTLYLIVALSCLKECSSSSNCRSYKTAKISITSCTKAIVDYTSPALCTPITPVPPIGDAAYHQHAGGGPSHGHRQHAQKTAKDRARYLCRQTDRQTDTHTDILITILGNCSLKRSSKTAIKVSVVGT